MIPLSQDDKVQQAVYGTDEVDVEEESLGCLLL